MAWKVLVKLSYLPNSRLKKINEGLKRKYNEDYRSIKFYLLDSPTIKAYQNVRALNPNDENYANNLVKKIESTQAIRNANGIIWEPHPNDPEIPKILEQIGYRGKLFLINSNGSEQYTYSNQLDYVFFDTEELIRNLTPNMLR